MKNWYLLIITIIFLIVKPKITQVDYKPAGIIVWLKRKIAECGCEIFEEDIKINENNIGNFYKEYVESFKEQSKEKYRK
jgi:hypothetical protein